MKRWSIEVFIDSPTVVGQVEMFFFTERGAYKAAAHYCDAEHEVVIKRDGIVVEVY